MAPELNPTIRDWIEKHTNWFTPMGVEDDETEELISLVEEGTDLFTDADPSDDIAVLNLDVSESEFLADIEDRIDDIRDLRVDTRKAWRRYQRRLEDAEEAEGIDEFHEKAQAKGAKGYAQDQQQRFERLWAEVIRMRQMWREHQKLKRRENEKSSRRVVFSELDSADVGKAADRLDQHREHEEENRRDIGHELDRAGMNVELDFDDIDKSIAELTRAEGWESPLEFDESTDSDGDPERRPPEGS